MTNVQKATLIIKSKHLNLVSYSRVFEYLTLEELANKIVDEVDNFWSDACDIFHLKTFYPVPNYDWTGPQHIREKYGENFMELLRDLNRECDRCTCNLILD